MHEGCHVQNGNGTARVHWSCVPQSPLSLRRSFEALRHKEATPTAKLFLQQLPDGNCCRRSRKQVCRYGNQDGDDGMRQSRRIGPLESIHCGPLLLSIDFRECCNAAFGASKCSRSSMRYTRTLPYNLPWLFHFLDRIEAGRPVTAYSSLIDLLSRVRIGSQHPNVSIAGLECPCVDSVSLFEVHSPGAAVPRLSCSVQHRDRQTGIQPLKVVKPDQ